MKAQALFSLLCLIAGLQHAFLVRADDEPDIHYEPDVAPGVEPLEAEKAALDEEDVKSSLEATVAEKGSIIEALKATVASHEAKIAELEPIVADYGAMKEQVAKHLKEREAIRTILGASNEVLAKETELAASQAAQATLQAELDATRLSNAAELTAKEAEARKFE